MYILINQLWLVTAALILLTCLGANLKLSSVNFYLKRELRELKNDDRITFVDLLLQNKVTINDMPYYITEWSNSYYSGRMQVWEYLGMSEKTYRELSKTNSELFKLD